MKHLGKNLDSEVVVVAEILTKILDTGYIQANCWYLAALSIIRCTQRLEISAKAADATKFLQLSLSRHGTQGSCAGLEFKASLEKSLNFRKLKKALNCFGKSGRPWKVWNLSIVKVSTRLGDCVNCHSCCKSGRRTAQTVLLINITHQCFKSVHLFFLSISRAVCYKMIDWKKDIELALNYWMKRPWKALNFVGLLAQEPWVQIPGCTSWSRSPPKSNNFLPVIHPTSYKFSSKFVNNFSVILLTDKPAKAKT